MSDLLTLTDVLSQTQGGTVLEWGTVSSPDPLLVQLSGVSTSAPVAVQAAEGAVLDSGDKVLLARYGHGGWVYVDRVVDVVERTEPDQPITALQPTPDATPGAPPVDPDTGEPISFVRLNAPGNVAVANLIFDRFNISWTYTRNTEANAPTESGFEIRVLDASTRDLVQVVYASAASRQTVVGGLAGRSYIPEIRTITTQAAVTAQYRALLSILGLGITAAYSDWSRAATTARRSPPASPVRAPSNPRWTFHGRGGVLGFSWSYRPRAGDETAARFEAMLCQNSIRTVGCQSATVQAPPGNLPFEAREARFAGLESNIPYYGAVRTVGASGRRSHWVSLRPTRTSRSSQVEIRNFTVRRAAAGSSDVVWSAEVRRATRFKFKGTLQISQDVAGTETNVGPPLELESDWQPITGAPNREGWFTISGREQNRYVGRGMYTVTLTVQNQYTNLQRAVSITVRALPLFVYQTIVQLGNRGATALVSGLLSLPGGRVVALAAKGIGVFISAIGQSLRHVFGVLRGQGVSVAGAAAQSVRINVQGLPARINIAATGYTGRAGPTAGTVIPTLFSGIRVEVETSYIGWETLQWQVGIRHVGGTTYTTDFSGTETNDHMFAPGSPFFWFTLISLVNLNNVLRARYFAPGVSIRLRTRATNSQGTTAWTNTFYAPNDFTFLSRGITGVPPS